MKKNPFSLFDFLGYVFPGAFALFLIYFFSQIEDLNGIQSIIQEIKDLKVPFKLEDTLLLTILSYILGHLVSYCSSLTIEQFTIWLYGYPSDFLLGDVAKWHYWQKSQRTPQIYNFQSFLKCAFFLVRTYSWRIFIGLIVLPITICSLLLGKCCGLKYFFIKKLDRILINTINQKCTDLAEFLNFDISEENTDFHRVINHYEYEQQKAHSIKMDNYVALYGFLRAITFIFNCLFIFVLYKSNLKVDFNSPINWDIIVLLVLLMLVTYLFFMGFIKFYRRFTLESFMCLIIDTSYLSKSTNQPTH